MAEVTIRSARLSDFDSVYTFVCELEEQQFDKETLRPLFANCLEKENHIYLIAETDGVPVGHISCHGQILLHHCGWVYEIEELYVMPEHRNKKIGAALLSAVENALQGKTCVSLEVASNMRRKNAHAFYEANGFDKTSYKFVKQPETN